MFKPFYIHCRCIYLKLKMKCKKKHTLTHRSVSIGYKSKELLYTERMSSIIGSVYKNVVWTIQSPCQAILKLRSAPFVRHHQQQHSKMYIPLYSCVSDVIYHKNTFKCTFGWLFTSSCFVLKKTFLPFRTCLFNLYNFSLNNLGVFGRGYNL